MRTLIVLLLCSVAAFGQRFTGYTQASTNNEKQIESALKAIPSPENERAFHRYFTSEPHPAGTEQNHQVALYIAEQWKKQGWEDVTIRQYDVLNSAPRAITLEMVAPVRYKASLREAAYPEDPDTKNPDVTGGWTGMSASGEVTAPLVYARGGNPEDYDLLAKEGIDVRGKVVIVRYSQPYSYRGFKAYTAQHRGVAALIIYSDPAEDGYKKGKVFPDGPWGPETHIQRGAITYDFIVPGDPLTPGWASVEGAKRIRPEESQSVPKIMAVAISWHDAKPLLEHIGGAKAPREWQGGLPITYRLGGHAKVHIKVDMDNSVKPNYVVEARLRGTELPDEWVLLGNHHDAWVFGGVDPSSGTASMMELTRALGQMASQGKRPRRTLVACSWDGEEVGLTGSTEWGEQFADQLKRKLVAYINVDSSASGPNFQGSAVGSLAPLLVEISHTLDDPASGTSLYEAWKKSVANDTERFAATGGGKRKAVVTDDTLVDTRIGSGSDHTVFLNALGRPVMGLNFDGPYGVYHSMYDDFFWMNHFGDPGYRYHTLMSKLWGVIALRLANADVLPFDFAFYARDIRTFLQEVCHPEGQLEACSAQQLDLTSVLQHASEFEAAGRELKAATEAALAAGELDRVKAASLNRAIMQVESNWLNPDGIPGRPWFKHMLYAARYTYAHLELPGITEAVERHDWETAREQAAILEKALLRNTELLKASVAELKGTK